TPVTAQFRLPDGIPTGSYDLFVSAVGISSAAGFPFTVGSLSAPPTVATPAEAAPNPVPGTTSALAVLGADDGGEPALVYTWSTTGTPPAPVAFSVNASNAAKNTTATFTKAGA